MDFKKHSQAGKIGGTALAVGLGIAIVAPVLTMIYAAVKTWLSRPKTP